MIGSRVGEVPTGWVGRAALLFGLVLLVTAHLSGGGHGAVPAGPHPALGVVLCTGADGGDGAGAAEGEHRPGHDHRVDSHVDHGVDRPRADSGDSITPPHEGGTAQRAEIGDELSLPRAGGHREAVPDGLGGRACLARHCVWRQ